MPLQNVSQVCLVLSGKGGVGKSSVTLQLALALTDQGYNVGILDIDLTGPSIPRLVGKEEAKVKQAAGGWLPVEVYPRVEAQNGSITTSAPVTSRTRGSLHALSLAFLLPSRSSAVIWRGPKKTAMIRQFLSDALWPPNTDFLLVDTPPGTSDEHIAIAEELHKLQAEAQVGAAVSGGIGGLPTPSGQLMGAVVVTTPQAISTSDVRKELNFCVKTSIPVLGVIENMAGYICPCCGEEANIFSKGGGEVMAHEAGVRFLGGVPVDTGFGSMVEGVIKKEEGQDEAGDPNIVTQTDDRILVERWKSQCARLADIFTGFVHQLLAGSQTFSTTA
ncbi:putative cytosolic fe-s cluster assembling factor cfd1 [Phaeomoniella chlamydospora]|uniref:Putative cytosolic fe-s cluster assembling factor cfd1 n=1 Tax=Phaeomoniella chlamydospora TaxID=158046 RepID=A0A0G2EIG3_PHACM|nr:putative cytosolic fe-s cluster assembling factor cfd1 [Phaeomoniella chlamydospora]